MNTQAFTAMLKHIFSYLIDNNQDVDAVKFSYKGKDYIANITIEEDKK